MMEKCAKDLADGKCSRTSPLPPTVGLARARGGMATCLQDGYTGQRPARHSRNVVLSQQIQQLQKKSCGSRGPVNIKRMSVKKNSYFCIFKYIRKNE